MTGWRRLFWVVVVTAVVAVVLTDVPAAYVLGPLLGLVVLRVGVATFGAMGASASVEDTAPEAVDPAQERTTYSCSQCGAEVVLVVRGEDTPPRHCGERMTEHREVPRS